MQENLYSQSSFILLHKIPYSESSLIIRAFTINSGKISFMVKGAKRKHSPFRSLDYFQIYDSEYKLSTKSDLHSLTGIESKVQFTEMQNNFNKQILGNVFLEIYLRYLHELEESLPLFEFLHHSLQELNDTDCSEMHYSILLSQFILSFLHLLGIKPELNQCYVCKKIVDYGPYFFSIEAGSIFCKHCQHQQNFTDTFVISKDLLSWLRHIEIRGLESHLNIPVFLVKIENFLIRFMQQKSNIHPKLKSLHLYQKTILTKFRS